MRRITTGLAMCACWAAFSAAPQAWGFDAHKHVAGAMIALLPTEIRPLFEARRAFIVERSVDPDLWRDVGWDAEPPNHYLDLDAPLYGPYPFDALPREYDKAVEKFGRAAVQQEGLLPWRTAEFYGRLQREFASLNRPTRSPYVLDNIVLIATVLAHYVSDGHVPLHAVKNYDGQLTGQPGAHVRFEAELFNRYAAALSRQPVVRPPVTDPRGAMFEILLESNRLAERLLAADRKASAGRQYYDEGFFAAYRDEIWPVLDQRVADSTSAAAAFITGAWERAGKPAVPLTLPPAPRRVPTPPPGR